MPPVTARTSLLSLSQIAQSLSKGPKQARVLPLVLLSRRPIRHASSVLPTVAALLSVSRPSVPSPPTLLSIQTRSYATEGTAFTVTAPPLPPPPPPPSPKPKRRFRVLRWAWRLTYLSAFFGLAYVGYGIYVTRNPNDQIEPDPSKKTLVILGKPVRPSITSVE